MKQEYEALMKNKTWTLVPLPLNRKAIRCKWVFWIKENAYETINRCKSRLVAKGFHQLPRCDFLEIFSPLIKHITIRVNLTLALTNR